MQTMVRLCENPGVAHRIRDADGGLRKREVVRCAGLTVETESGGIALQHFETAREVRRIVPARKGHRYFVRGGVETVSAEL